MVLLPEDTVPSLWSLIPAVDLTEPFLLDSPKPVVESVEIQSIQQPLNQYDHEYRKNQPGGNHENIHGLDDYSFVIGARMSCGISRAAEQTAVNLCS